MYINIENDYLMNVELRDIKIILKFSMLKFERNASNREEGCILTGGTYEYFS